MTHPHRHTTHPGLVKRLKRAEGHLRHVIEMIGAERPCAEIAMQLQAVEKAITAAKRTLIHDHIDHCLDDLPPPGDSVDTQAFAEFRQIAKYL